MTQSGLALKTLIKVLLTKGLLQLLADIWVNSVEVTQKRLLLGVTEGSLNCKGTREGTRWANLRVLEEARSHWECLTRL